MLISYLLSIHRRHKQLYLDYTLGAAAYDQVRIIEKDGTERKWKERWKSTM